MKAVSKFIYKRTPGTKNTIVVLENEKCEKFFLFTCLFLINVDDLKPSEKSNVVRFFNDKVLYKEEILLSETSVEAVVFVRNPAVYTGQMVKLKPKK